MTQPTLWDAPPREAPIARRTDPRTSHLAAARVTASGARTSQKARILAHLRKGGEHTSWEVARALGMDRYVTARRLPDLAHDGKAEKAGARVCEVAGSMCVTWRARE